MSFSQTLFGFRGRIARLPFFGYFLLGMVFVAILACTSALVLGSAANRNSGLTYVLGFAMLAASVVGYFWITISLNVKRLHDLGLPGIHLIWIIGIGALAGGLTQANQTLSIICYVAQLCIGLWLLFAPGESQANRFGPPPGGTVSPHPYAPAPGPMPGPAPSL